jgi:outer membrane PBP1 activator LpoA protein
LVQIEIAAIFILPWLPVYPVLLATMSSPAPQTYSSLRSELRHQESKTEIALAELSSLTNSPPSQQDIQIEDRLIQIFAQRHETIDAMSRLLETDPSGGGGARVHQVARAREILVEHEKEFRRMKVYRSLSCAKKV